MAMIHRTIKKGIRIVSFSNITHKRISLLEIHKTFNDRGIPVAYPFILYVGFSAVYPLQSLWYFSPTIAQSDIINVTNYTEDRQIFGQLCTLQTQGAIRQSNLNKVSTTAVARNTCNMINSQ